MPDQASRASPTPNRIRGSRRVASEGFTPERAAGGSPKGVGGCIPLARRTPLHQLPDQSGADLHLARITDAGPDRAVEVEDEVRVLRHEDVRAVEYVEDLDDGLEGQRLAELELLGEPHVEGGVRVVLAA